MLQYLNRKRGQSTLEYAVLIIVIIGALLSIQNYIKRGVQGRLKASADDIGDQYSVGNTNAIKRTMTNSSTRDTFHHGITNSSLTAVENTITRESRQIANVDQEYWGK